MNYVQYTREHILDRSIDRSIDGRIHGLAVSSSAASDPYGDIHPVRSTVCDRVRGRSLTASDRWTVMYSDCITSLTLPVRAASWYHDIDIVISTRSAESDIQLTGKATPIYRIVFCFPARPPGMSVPSLSSDGGGPGCAWCVPLRGTAPIPDRVRHQLS